MQICTHVGEGACKKGVGMGDWGVMVRRAGRWLKCAVLAGLAGAFAVWLGVEGFIDGRHALMTPLSQVSLADLVVPFLELLVALIAAMLACAVWDDRVIETR